MKDREAALFYFAQGTIEARNYAQLRLKLK